MHLHHENTNQEYSKWLLRINFQKSSLNENNLPKDTKKKGQLNKRAKYSQIPDDKIRSDQHP